MQDSVFNEENMKSFIFLVNDLPELPLYECRRMDITFRSCLVRENRDIAASFLSNLLKYRNRRWPLF